MLMIDIEGKTLTPEDKQLLKNPKVGGIILFTRNYDSPEQLIHLTNEIHELRTPPLMIAVDHEGGRVQRFRDGFTPLPPMRELGELYDKNSHEALEKAEHIGFTMGSELRAAGINCSFAPILDIDAGISQVIGNRSFHFDPAIIIKLAGALITGMKKAGLITVGKHFPGHGHVEADSHVAIPIDHRDLQEIQNKDILPFKSLINQGLDGIMPAHVIYEKIDKNPAGFSAFWLQDILRQQLGFKGIIFSDDLSMEGASPMGNMIQRVEKAKHAGCDMILICNNRQAAKEVINHEYP
jgi:beta-N-acetylhexosaminidase